MFKKLKERRERFAEYINSPSIKASDRSFILFSIAVLFALFVAIPCGLIMKEPPVATISTLAGAVFFLIYVIISVKKNTINRAKIVISIILVFFFLPGMFFSNGGAEGGTPVWLLLGTIYIAMILEGKFRTVMLILNFAVSAASWIVGYYFPQYVVSYSRGGNYFDAFAGMMIVSIIIYTLIMAQSRVLKKEEEAKNSRRLFEQTAIALASAIDAKDKYTHGHSARVAEYAKKIAKKKGKSEKECDEIYYAALLHDVGKIGVPEAIITKEGKLDDEEYERIKQHPTLGAQILQSISEFPYLSIGAVAHHERYDGKGYPFHLKGEDIPEIARIISVADAYDAMTSKRSYRDPIPQQIVREELVKGSGTQFDPEYARIMLHLIDVDTEYEMSDREEGKELAGAEEILIDEHRSEVSEGILITPCMTTIRMKVRGYDQAPGRFSFPSLILFDSLDGRVHETEREKKDLNYFEYGELWFDGRTTIDGARKIKTDQTRTAEGAIRNNNEYKIEAVKIKDHMLVRIIGKMQTVENIIALPDSTRYTYIGLTGEHCKISNVLTEKEEEEKEPGFIPRIAEEISFINVPAGDIPNVQIDGYRTDASEGIEIKDGLKISFHAKSLPTARLVWHCPFIDIFNADDGKVYGENYRELAFMRFDGESWQCDDDCDLKQNVVTSDAFDGWEAWKKFCHDGFDAVVTFKTEDNRITIMTENAGISVKSTVIMNGIDRTVYAAVTGDQIAVTNIRIG